MGHLTRASLSSRVKSRDTPILEGCCEDQHGDLHQSIYIRWGCWQAAEAGTVIPWASGPHPYKPGAGTSARLGSPPTETTYGPESWRPAAPRVPAPDTFLPNRARPGRKSKLKSSCDIGGRDAASARARPRETPSPPNSAILSGPSRQSDPIVLGDGETGHLHPLPRPGRGHPAGSGPGSGCGQREARARRRPRGRPRGPGRRVSVAAGVFPPSVRERGDASHPTVRAAAGGPARAVSAALDDPDTFALRGAWPGGTPPTPPSAGAAPAPAPGPHL